MWRARRVRIMANKALEHLGSILALIGGIILLVLGIIGFLGFSFMLIFESPIHSFYGFGLLAVILGIIAIVGHRHVNELIWAIVLIVVGFIGGGAGGLLVLLGGIFGLLSKYVK